MSKEDTPLDPALVDAITEAAGDNITPFTPPPSRSGEGHPPDRSGTMPQTRGEALPFEAGKTRQQKRSEARQAEKDIRRIQKQLNSPITHQEHQSAMMRLMALFNGLAEEMKRQALLFQTIKRILAEKGIYSMEELQKEAEEQVAWNNEITDLLTGFQQGDLSIREACARIHHWNETGHKLQITWDHVDLAPRLLDDETLTVEEKIEIAAEMSMPEKFIEGLRTQADPPAADPAE